MNQYPSYEDRGYRIESELGRNQFSGRVTYLAIQIETQDLVVIKQFQFARSGLNWSGYTAYESEIQILKTLDYPKIPQYLDSFETEDGFCLVQEYKKAKSAAQIDKFSLEEVRQIAISILETLVYLQEKHPPIVHRDIKPENILVDRGEEFKVYLVDFGFARVGGDDLAASSVVKGTLGFMPPEQMFSRQLTEASDLYSLGVTLICLLTEIPSANIGQFIDETNRIQFKSKLKKLSPKFIDWLSKMSEPNLKNRYTNAAEALEAFRSIEPIDSNRYPVSKSSLIQRFSIVSLGFLGCSLGLFKVYTMIRQTVNIYESNRLTWDAKVSIENQKSGEAILFLETAIKLNPKNAEAWTAQCWVLWTLDRNREALQSCDRALEIDPSYYWPLHHRGRVLSNLGQYQDALKSFQQALWVNPDYGPAWHGQGVVLQHLNQNDRAIESFKKGVEFEPNVIERWCDYGDALNQANRHQEALAIFEKASMSPEQLACSWFGQGIALEGLNRNQEALSAYEKALKIRPQSPQIIQQRNQLRLKLGDRSRS